MSIAIIAAVAFVLAFAIRYALAYRAALPTCRGIERLIALRMGLPASLVTVRAWPTLIDPEVCGYTVRVLDEVDSTAERHLGDIMAAAEDMAAKQEKGERQ